MPHRSLPFGALLMALLIAPAAAQTQAGACAPPDPSSPSGAYRAADGAVLSVLPAEAPGRWRITHFDTGRSHQLHPTEPLRFRAAADLQGEQPVAFHYAFALDAQGRPQSLTINAQAPAARIALRERAVAFKNGDTELGGTLTLPASGTGPFKTVILVHGSDPTPSAGREWLPHLLAPQGIATLVFDKRGTGCSKGQYLQHFEVLAGDVVAAARWLRTQPEIDAQRIGLTGFSQGGWVAPLAALRDPSLRFVAVGYGLAMSLADEDRLEAPLKLRALGMDEASVAEFEALNAALHQTAREGFRDWRPFEVLWERAQARPWWAVAARQASWIGVVAQMGLAQAKQAAPPMFEHFFQPFYDPVPTLEKLKVPMLWLIAGQDIEAPPEPTLAVLARLRGQGKPISVQVFAHADHGLQEFELREGQRVRTKYAEGYFPTLLRWLQAQ